MKKRFSEAQIIGFLREADAGVAVTELCRRHGFSDASYYLWRRKFGGLEVSDAKRLKALEQENARLKKLLAEAVLEQAVTQEVLRKSGRRTGSSRGGALDVWPRLTERQALTVIGMSASSLRYRPAPDRNADLRGAIVALAHRYRRYGAGMIYLKLRQQGRVVNHKRIERLYAEAQLQVRCRTRKKVPVGERQPLVRPAAANEVWSMDFVFDRSADGRTIKCLTIVDDATHESVAIVPERAISGQHVTRILDHLATTRGLPQVIRTDNGKEFCGHAMLTWPMRTP